MLLGKEAPPTQGTVGGCGVGVVWWGMKKVLLIFHFEISTELKKNHKYFNHHSWY